MASSATEAGTGVINQTTEVAGEVAERSAGLGSSLLETIADTVSSVSPNDANSSPITVADAPNRRLRSGRTGTAIE
jgi:hypothetical protein